MNDRRTVVAVFAHPDDEVFSTGGTLARYAREFHVVLVVATRGELGEIRVPGIATPENLHEVREREVRASARALGIHEVRFLDYRDSGMAGTPGNHDARSLLRADRDEAAGKVVAILRELGPEAVLTFEETGGYGHPDHITVHQLTTAAFDAAVDPATFPEAGPVVELGRLFYSGFPRRLMRAIQEQARASGADIGPLAQLDAERYGLPDEAIDVVIDVRDHVERKLAAFQAHQTQFGDNQLMTEMPEGHWRQLLEYEYFQLARGEPLPGPRPAGTLLG